MNDDTVARPRDWGGRLVPFPAEFVDRYRHGGLWGVRTLAQELRLTADTHPQRPALVCGSEELSYQELDRRTDQLGAALHQQGLPVGGTVLMQVNNTTGAVLAWYAVLKAGLIPVCTLSLHRRHEISQIAALTQPVAHLVDADNRGFDLAGFALEQAAASRPTRQVLTLGGTDRAGVLRLDDLGRDLDPVQARALVSTIQAGISPDDVAVLQLSGGTTGVPKVIPHLHAEYWHYARAYADSLGWTAQERVAYVGPLVHNAGIVCGLHGPHSVGALAVLGQPDLAQLIPLLVDQQATDIVLGPFAYGAAVDPALSQATALRRVVFSGKKVPREHFHAVTDQGIWAGQLFGMGEGLACTTRPGHPAAVRLLTVGVPISELDEAVILEPGGTARLPDGQVGELAARGPYTARGYFDSAEYNATAWTPDGFYRTGDLAVWRTIDGVRCLSIEGRIKELINRGGEKINTSEVELLLAGHPAIDEAALVAMPDDRLGERACAFVVGSGPDRITLPDLRVYLADLGVAKYKWPERLEWLERMPRASDVGKADKKTLRLRAADLGVQQ